MLPSLHHQCYLEFQQALEQLQKVAEATDLRPTTLADTFQEVQQLYQNQITSLRIDDVALEHASRWQSFQTEIHKQMRLLQTDVMLLRASRTAATSRSRAAGASDRINILIRYCQALLQQTEE
jgi:hypothetical protein